MLRWMFVVTSLALAVLAHSGSAPVRAQTPPAAQVQSNPSTSAPGRLERLKERTKETWAQMKKRWSLQREKYAACRNEARKQRLAGRKTRKFLEDCMGG